MHTPHFLICVVLLLSVLVTLAHTQSGTTFPQRVGLQLKNEDLSAAALDKAAATGAQVVRKGIYWENIEATPGVYDWTQTDTWIADMEARNFTMLITIVWNNLAYENIYPRAIVTQAGREAYANFVGDLVARYAGKDIWWEIWNEPNLQSFWHNTASGNSNTDEMAEEYTALVLAAVPAMKSADPNCRVAVGSISALWSQSFSWFERCIETGLLTSGADAISVHPYGFSWPELCLRSGYNVIRHLLDTNGGEAIQIISSEVGYNEGWLTDRGVPSAEVEDYQAYQFVREYLMDAMSDIVLGIWYELTDPSWGVLENNLTERPTFTAAQVLTAQLAGYAYEGRLDLGSDEDFAVVLVNGNGDRQTVVWTTPGQDMPAGAKLPATHSVDVPVSGPGTYQVVDVWGQATSLSTTTDSLTITLTGAPQYIEQTGSVALDYEVTMDNYEATRVGSWGTSSGSSGYWGENYMLDGNSGKGSKTATYSPKLTKSGEYLVSARWAAAWNRDTNTPMDVVHDDGTTTVTVNQRNNGGVWNSLGVYNITAGTGSVVIRNANTTNYVIADGIRFTLVEERVAPAPPPVSTNVALGKTVTASKADGASNLVDGLFTTNSRWFSYYFSEEGAQWAQVDLGGSYTVDRVVWAQHAARTDDYIVEIYDGSAWTQVASGANMSGTATIEASFSPVSATSVRFTAVDGGYYLKVYEMEVYGYAN